MLLSHATQGDTDVERKRMKREGLVEIAEKSEDLYPVNEREKFPHKAKHYHNKALIHYYMNYLTQAGG